MLYKHLFLSGLLLLSLAIVSGCEQKITKQDNAAPAPTAQPAQHEGDTQAQAATQSAAPAAAAPPTDNGNSAAQPSPPVAESATAKDPIAASALLPLPPQAIVDTIKKLTSHPRVRYLSRTAQYSYYVGGLFDAEYDINKDRLVITNAAADTSDTVTCQYDKDGKMLSKKKSIPSQQVTACNNLINELSTYLSR
jgi:hypothetical protein